MCVEIDDEVVRRDSLHALINQLPDPNYATLRQLVIHLYRVQEHSSVNRMNTGNLAICFGPTLFGDSSNNMQDAGWAVRAVDTIIQHCYSIFVSRAVIIDFVVVPDFLFLSFPPPSIFYLVSRCKVNGALTYGTGSLVEWSKDEIMMMRNRMREGSLWGIHRYIVSIVSKKHDSGDGDVM